MLTKAAFVTLVVQIMVTAAAAPTKVDGDVDAELERLRAKTASLVREVKMLRVQIDELERLADSDTLTPLLNRRAFLREVERGIARVARHGTPMAVMIADLDNLKAINDRDGHQAGDAALLHVGSALKASVRASDTVARIGGDEFGLVIEDLDAVAAAAKVQALAAGIAAVPVDGFQVSVSIGHTMVTADDSLDSIIARADSAMYAAKRTPR